MRVSNNFVDTIENDFAVFKNSKLVALTQLGRASPTKSEKPKTNRFRLDSNEQFFMFDKPTPVIIANMTQNNPPTTGSGIVTNSDENFPHKEKVINKIPATLKFEVLLLKDHKNSRIY